jgi:lipopolysaccharide assembly outer membrane protein LptD (OstA)
MIALEVFVIFKHFILDSSSLMLMCLIGFFMYVFILIKMRPLWKASTFSMALISCLCDFVLLGSIYASFCSALLAQTPQSSSKLSLDQALGQALDRLGWTELSCDKLTWQQAENAWKLDHIKINWKTVVLKAELLIVKEEDQAWRLEGKGKIELWHQDGHLKADQIKYIEKENRLFLEGNISGHWKGYQMEAQKIILDLTSLDLELLHPKLKFDLKALLKHKTIKV